MQKDKPRYRVLIIPNRGFISEYFEVKIFFWRKKGFNNCIELMPFSNNKLIIFTKIS